MEKILVMLVGWLAREPGAGLLYQWRHAAPFPQQRYGVGKLDLMIGLSEANHAAATAAAAVDGGWRHFSRKHTMAAFECPTIHATALEPSSRRTGLCAWETICRLGEFRT